MTIHPIKMGAESIQLREVVATNAKFKIAPILEKKIYKISDNQYELKLFVSIKNTLENPFPIEFETVFSGKFEFREVEDEKLIDEYLNFGAIQYMYPFVRSLVSNVFSAALLPALLLPLIDVRDFKFRTKEDK